MPVLTLVDRVMIREDGLLKYPRTPHLEGSRLQEGDSAHDQVPLASLAGQHMVIEEKLDGANAGVSFSDDAELRLQSRGHFLVGGSRERHFNRFKQWAQAHEDAFFDVLGTRYIMFGEWMHAKHSMFYDALPHLFLEFDIFDKQQQVFLSTPRRHALLATVPVVSVPVLSAGPTPELPAQLLAWVRASVGRTAQWKDTLAATALREGLEPDRVRAQTDADHQSEGLYLKMEDDHQVLARYKFVRASFTQAIMDQDEHWHKRPIVPNQLRPGVDIFSPTIDKSWPAPEAPSEPIARRPR
jgi:hypothetical protein